VGLALAAAFELTTFWGTRAGAYGRIAGANLIQGLAGEGVKIGLGLLGVRPLGLILGQMSAQGAAAATIICGVRHSTSSLRSVSYRSLRRVAKLYKSFPRLRLPSHLLLQISSQAPLFIIAALYGSDTAGGYAMAFSLVALPASIIGQAVGTAYYGEIAKIGSKDRKSLSKITLLTELRILAIALPIGLAAAIFGGNLEILLGSQWNKAADYFSYLVPSAVAQLVATPAIQALNVLNRQEVYLYSNVLRTALLGLLFFICYHNNISSDDFVISYSLVMTAFYAIMCGIVAREVHAHKKQQL
jgi:O-antigen/teichoic acid export membrane protein